MTFIRKLLALFTPAERKQLALLLACVVLTAVVEVAGIASILPFMGVVAKPEVVQSSHVLAVLYDALGFQSSNRFLIFLGSVVLFILVASNVLSAMMSWFILKFSHDRIHSLSSRLIAQYLSQPYSFFVSRNSAELIRKVLSEASRVVGNVVIPSAQVFAKGIVVLLIVCLLFAVDPLLATAIISVLGTAYLLLFRLARARLDEMGQRAIQASAQRFLIANEAFGGIKDIKLLGREQEFLRRYSLPSQLASRYEAASQAIAQIPRYAMESIAFGGILLIVLYLIGIRRDISNVLPLLALYAFAGYRLMPALQFIFGSLATIRFNQPALDQVHADLSRPSGETHARKGPPLRLQKELQLSAVSYSYEGSTKPVLQNVSLVIQAHTTVGLVGATGAGKTTIADLILGLISPNAGTLSVDGEKLSSENIRRWQSSLGYVPQFIYLSDDTIARNIAFGLPDDDVDHSAVQRAAKAANLHDFITGQLPAGYNSVVGERGVRLSGGQRQRIGIARALYSNPELLVLDEATSSLDGVTESVVMEAIHSLAGKKTIIVIAHRITTLRECNIIHIVEEGNIVASGSYQELLSNNATFRAMANARDASHLTSA